MEEPHQPAGRLLVVDDDPDIRDLLRDQLERAGFSVEVAGTVCEAQALLASRLFHLAILDLSLPDGEGLDLCRALVDADTRPAIIIVSARDAAVDRVLGLETGADDYLTKPFEPRELIARVRNLLRRSAEPGRGPTKGGTRFAAFGPWRLDLIKRRLLTPEASVVMVSTAEFELLLRFVHHPNQPLSRDDLVPERKETVWLDRSLDNRVHRLRQKLAQIAGGEDLILTVRNQGYCLTSAVRFE